ncbi:MAG: EamA family transporter RarD [Pseudomonadota bacterium]
MDKKGIVYALAAYTLFGVLPIYWKALDAVPSLQILIHRMLWSLVFLLVVLALQRNWRWIRGVLAEKRTFGIYLVSASVIGLNWGIYVWAVNAGHIVESSLGYFINPLVSVLFGVLFFRESLRLWQWIAILIATAGVLYLTYDYGKLPWISLSLALTFAFYGVLKKRASLGSLEGLTLEMAILFLPALSYILFVQATGQGAVGQISDFEHLLLALTGVATAVPLIFFAAAAQRIPLYMIGVLQYIAPTLQLIIGVAIYDEPFPQSRLIGFAIIWFALAVFTLESLMQQRKRLVQGEESGVLRNEPKG